MNFAHLASCSCGSLGLHVYARSGSESSFLFAFCATMLHAPEVRTWQEEEQQKLTPFSVPPDRFSEDPHQAPPHLRKDVDKVWFGQVPVDRLISGHLLQWQMPVECLYSLL